MTRGAAVGKILVVEDSGAVSDLVAQILTSRGYAVTTAASGVDALATLKQAATIPDLILLDMGLPVMGGEEFLAVKALLPPPACLVPVVIFTAHPDVCIETQSPDVVHVIHKPADLETITAIVQRYMGGESSCV